MGMARPQEPFPEARPAAPPPACWPQQGFQLPTEGRPSLLQLSLLQARGPFQVVEAAVQAGQLRGTMRGGPGGESPAPTSCQDLRAGGPNHQKPPLPSLGGA